MPDKAVALLLPGRCEASHSWPRSLVYTAVTRGKRLVVVIAQPKARALAVRGARARRRWAKLGESLGGRHEAARQAAAETLWGERPPG